MTILVSFCFLLVVGILVAIAPDSNHTPQSVKVEKSDEAFQAAQADYFADSRYWR